jgi:L-lactate dehydrogenase complex protein LldE
MRNAGYDATLMKVGLFVTCLVDLVRPRIGFAALKLLEGAGCEVHVPATQTCCGQPGWNSGERDSAAALAGKLVAEFAGCDYVVVPSGSCAGMIKAHYKDVLGHNPLAAKTWELTDFLVNVVKLESVPGAFRGAVTYHDSCSGLRELGVKAQPRALLARVPGLSLREMKDCEICCGFGGTFAVKMGEISSAIVEAKCRRIEESGADAVVLGDLGCILNIEGRLSREGKSIPVLHVAEVLAGDA